MQESFHGLLILLALILLPLARTLNTALSSELTLYSESNFRSNEWALLNQTRLELDFWRNKSLLTVYAGAVFQQSVEPGLDPALRDLPVSPFLGFRLQSPGFPVIFFSEWRQSFRPHRVFSFQPATEPDPRIGAFAYQWSDLFRFRQNLVLFEEFYGEEIFSPALDPTLTPQADSKTGFRFFFSQKIQGDVYSETLLKSSSELGPAIRIRLQWPSFSIALSSRVNLLESRGISTLLVIAGDLHP